MDIKKNGKKLHHSYIIKCKKKNTSNGKITSLFFGPDMGAKFDLSSIKISILLRLFISTFHTPLLTFFPFSSFNQFVGIFKRMDKDGASLSTHTQTTMLHNHKTGNPKNFTKSFII